MSNLFILQTFFESPLGSLCAVFTIGSGGTLDGLTPFAERIAIVVAMAAGALHYDLGAGVPTNPSANVARVPAMPS